MGLFDKFKDKLEENLINATEKMDRSMTIQWASNFKSAYESSQFDSMKTFLEKLNEYDSSRFLYNCAWGIFIISSAEKNNHMDYDDQVALMLISSNLKKLKDVPGGSSNAEKELRRWYSQEFDKLVNKHDLAQGIGWKSL